MKYLSTEMEGLYVIEPRVFADDRGYFMESFNRKVEQEKGLLNYDWVQDNEARSNKGVLRGFHYQKGEHAQAKLVRVIQGAVQDVVVDLRSGSSTFRKSYSILLSGENKKQLLIPRGFAHAYLVLEDDTIFAYKCDNYYNVESEGGLYYADPLLKIDWMLEDQEFQLSAKDKVLKNLENCAKFE